MPKQRSVWVQLSFALLGTAGCAAFSPSDIVDARPTGTTVEAAMRQVGRGFVALRQELDADPRLRLGLYACRVSVVFNIAGSAQQGGEAVIDGTVRIVPPAGDAEVSARATQTNASSASVGNQITIQLENPVCTLKDISVASIPGSTVSQAGRPQLPSAPYRVGDVQNQRALQNRIFQMMENDP